MGGKVSTSSKARISSSPSSEDRISSLPDEAREHILKFLPLREAAKSSILSTEWRNKWIHLPTLVIDDSFGKNNKLIVSNLYRVLDLHRGPLREFSLSLSNPISPIEGILSCVPFGNIEILTIETGPPHRFDILRQMLSSFSRLKSLRLSSCKFAFSPVSFEGFDRLAVLELRDVMFKEFQPLLSFRCPQLTTLTLDRWGAPSAYPRTLEVEQAAKLARFHLVGCYDSIRLKQRSLLLKHMTLRDPCFASSVEFRGFTTLESLTIGNIPKTINSTNGWMRLRQLTVYELRLSTKSEVWRVVRIITFAPKLQQLAIQMGKGGSNPEHGDEKNTEDDEAALKCEKSPMLTTVEVGMIEGTEHETALISWILKSSPALDKMEIQLSAARSDTEKLKVAIELNGLERASSRARIIVS